MDDAEATIDELPPDAGEAERAVRAAMLAGSGMTAEEIATYLMIGSASSVRRLLLRYGVSLPAGTGGVIVVPVKISPAQREALEGVAERFGMSWRAMLQSMVRGAISSGSDTIQKFGKP